MDTLLQDLRYAFRHLRRSPGFAVAAVLTLAFGIGANTAMFTVLNTLMIQRLPIKDPDGLISITSRNARGVPRPMPILAVEELTREGPLEDVCGYNGGGIVGAEANGIPTQTVVAFVSGKCFTTFGVMPILGRPIVEADAPLSTAGEKVAVISHRFWTRMFAADPAVLGRTLRMEGAQMTVVGVLPEGFGGIQVDGGIDVFAPPDTIIPATSDRRPVASEILGRLRQGVTLEQASAQIAAMWPAVLEATGPTAQVYEGADLFGSIPVVERMAKGVSRFRTQFGRPLTSIFGLTSLLLLLACINLGSLLLTRLTARGTELAVRLALGGSKSRIAQQMLLEGFVLSFIGAALALPLSFAFTAPLVSFIPPGLVEPTISFTPDWRVLSVTALVGLSTGVLMTALPLLVAMRRHAQTQFMWDRTIVGTTNHWARGLLVAQVALSVVLLVGAGLLIRSLYLLQRTNLGVRTEGVLYARLMPVPGGARVIDPAAYYPALLARVTAITGVRSAAVARAFTRITTTEPETPIAFAGEEHGDARAIMETVSPGFFATLGIPLRAGRPLSWSDHAKARQVAVVSESLARALTPDGDVLQRRVRLGTLRDFQDIVVVGVVGNASFGHPRLPAPPVLYLSPLQMGRFGGSMGLVVAVDGDPSPVAAGLRQVVREAGSDYAHRIIGLDELFARAPASERMSATLAGIVAGLAVLLALIGVHGTLAYSVSRRTREIGVRVAIGASPATVARAVLRDAFMLTLAGVAIGVPLALLASRALAALLFGISRADPVTFVGTILLFLTMGFAAGIVPARRAAGVDPVVALRAE